MENYLLLLDLNPLLDKFLSGWVAPVFFLILAVYVIMYVKNKEFRGMMTFIGIAVIAALVIFFGKDLFGSNGIFTNVAKDAANTIKDGNFIYWLPWK